MAKRIVQDEDLEKLLENRRRALYRDVSKQIREAVKESGLAQRAIAERMNTSSHTPLLKAMDDTNLLLSTVSDVAFALGKKVKITLE